MTISSRKFHYEFAHIGLPKIFFEDGEKLYNSFASGNPDKEVSRLWRTLAEEFNLHLSDTLTCEFHTIDHLIELIVITMPPAIEMTEAIYIGLVFTLKQKMFSNTIEPNRYFTLELSGTKSKPEFMFCEWDNSTKHLNYGPIKNGSIDEFIYAVKSLIVNGYIANRKLPANNEQLPQDKKNEVQTNSIKDIDIDQLVERWVNVIPDELFKQSYDEVGLFHTQCKVMFNLIDVYKRIPKRKLSQLQLDIKDAIVETAGRSLILGVEFGDIGLSKSSKINDISDMPVLANIYLKEIREPAVIVNYHLIDLASGHKPNAKEESEKALIHLINGQMNCFKLGVKYGEGLHNKEPRDASSEILENNAEDKTEEERIKVKLENSKPEDVIKKSDENTISDTFKDILEVAINDPDPEVRKQAQIGLKEIWPGGLKAFDNMLFDFIEGLRDPNKRQLSFGLLPAYGEMALPQLKMYLKDPDPEIRKLVTQIIVEIEKNRPMIDE